MDEQNILGHLLKIEAEAAALVDDAQAEADRRLSEGEKQNRARYDETYAREAAAAEESFNTQIEDARRGYREKLDAYKQSLTQMKRDETAFAGLVDRFFAGGK